MTQTPEAFPPSLICHLYLYNLCSWLTWLTQRVAPVQCPHLMTCCPLAPECSSRLPWCSSGPGHLSWDSSGPLGARSPWQSRSWNVAPAPWAQEGAPSSCAVGSGFLLVSLVLLCSCFSSPWLWEVVFNLDFCAFLYCGFHRAGRWKQLLECLWSGAKM